MFLGLKWRFAIKAIYLFSILKKLLIVNITLRVEKTINTQIATLTL